MDRNKCNFFNCTINFLCVANSTSDCFIYQHHYQNTVINYELCHFSFWKRTINITWITTNNLDHSKMTPKPQDTPSPMVLIAFHHGVHMAARQPSHCSQYRAQIKAVGSKLYYTWYWKLMNQCHHSLKHVEFIHICYVIYSVLNEIWGDSCTVLIIKTNYGNHSIHNPESSHHRFY